MECRSRIFLEIEAQVTISRVKHGAETYPATDATVILCLHDLLSIVGPPSGLEAMERVIGHHTDEDLVLEKSAVTYRRVAVTDRNVLGKTVGELDLDDRFGVAVTRVTRADLEMSAVPGSRFSVRRSDTAGRQGG